jgi:hypothetical protein
MIQVTIGEIKTYLGIDGEDYDKILSVFLDTAVHTIEKVLRRALSEDDPPVIKTAIMYIVWQLYFHRDDQEFKMTEVEKNVAIMLSDIRKAEF